MVSAINLDNIGPGGAGDVVAKYRRLAEQGDAEAQTNLGWHYFIGAGVPHDEEEAARWYRKAIEGGSIEARVALAEYYVSRKPPNMAEARRLYQSAIDSGHEHAADLMRKANARTANGRVSPLASKGCIVLGGIGLGGYLLLPRQMRLLGFFMFAAAVMWALAVFLRWLASLGRGTNLPKGQRQPVSADWLTKNYPGYNALPDDFGRVGSEYYRINSNGTWVKLKKWDFDSNTGEFMRITSRTGRDYLVNTDETYNKRAVAWHTWRKLGWLRHGTSIVVTLFSLAIISNIISADNAGQRGNFIFLAVLTVPVFAVLAYVLSFFANEAMIKGPEPLRRRAADDFGPTSTGGQLETAPPPNVDLSYRPNI